MKARTKQIGFVSIIVASLLMIMLALITVGFTRLMQREQRQVIDRQLSSQALYAAEAGVNDVAAAITASTPGYVTSPKTDCDPSALPSSDLSGDGTVAVTCALFNEEPGTLNYDIGTENSKIAELRTASTNNFNSINVTWGREGIALPAENGIGSLESCASSLASIAEYPATRPGVVPILKFDLSSVVGGNYDRTSLLQNTDYIYFVPCDGAGVGSHPFDASSRGNVIPVPCSGTDLQPCSVDINGLLPPVPYASNAFFARIRPVYENAAVSITGTEDTGAGIGPVRFAGAQVGIDVTARSSDVVRRLRVSVPISSSGDVPEYALQSFDGICKQLDVIDDTVPGANIVDNCSPLPPGPDPPPPGPVPSGDGFSPTAVSGRIYNMFHHRQGVVIVCHAIDQTYCDGPPDRAWFEDRQYFTPQHSNLVEYGGSRLYYSAQGNPAEGGPANTFGIGCFDAFLNRSCGFVALGTTNFVSNFANVPDTDFTAGVDNIVLINDRLYTIAVDNAGNRLIYCADPTGGTPVPCAGFTPFNIGVPPIPVGSTRTMEAEFTVSGNSLVYSTTAILGFNMYMGCFDVATQNRCAGWSTNTITSPVYNISPVRIGNSFCVHRSRDFNPVFVVYCIDIANGNSVAPPPNYLTQPKPAGALVLNSNWFSWGEYTDGSKIYIAGTKGTRAPHNGGLYCYDTSISNICAGWGGGNGWEDGSSVGNDFSGLETYSVIRVGGCLFGVGDNSAFPPTGIAKLSPTNAGVCP